MANTSIYQDIAARTGGNIYLGVVGPVRTGKSTFVKRFMELLVLPSIADPYLAERARDELPQSGSGKTIMTTEPKFIPEEAVTIAPDDNARMQVRLIDSVGYMVDGAVGATEDGVPRMITTPWFDHEIPMTQAAELGTKKVMEDHATIGVVVTTDGSITDIPRADYIDAERRSIQDMQATGKPFVVVINSQAPQSAEAQALAEKLRQTYGVGVLCLNCLQMDKETLGQLLRDLLLAFPLTELRFFLPGWVQALGAEHRLKKTLYDAMRTAASGICVLRQANQAAEALGALEQVTSSNLDEIDLGSGAASIRLSFPEALFYQALGEASGFEISDDAQLMALLREMAQIKEEYARLAPALEAVRATGYGVVMPGEAEMQLEKPELFHRGGSCGIRIRASAPSIHMLRSDIVAEISPMVGDARQSESLARQMQTDYENDSEKLWESNIFGKSVSELIRDGFTAKLNHLPEDARMKLRNALTRIVNEGAGGLICILF